MPARPRRAYAHCRGDEGASTPPQRAGRLGAGMTVAKCETAAPYCHRVHTDFVKATLAVDGSVGTGWWRAARLLSVARYPTFQTRAVSPHGSLICNRIQHARARRSHQALTTPRHTPPLRGDRH